MRITHVESYAVPIAGVRPTFAWRFGLRGAPPDGTGAVLRIGTDSGAEGVALAPRRGAGWMLQDIVDRVLRDELVGADPLQREWLWHRLWELDRTEELPLYILGLVDTALWDLAGREPADLAAPRRVSAVDRRLRVNGDIRDCRGVPRCDLSMPGAWLPRDQAACLG
jgi:L-alanine-DL-glutamate epimerase-like enolase superfamily enzyme